MTDQYVFTRNAQGRGYMEGAMHEILGMFLGFVFFIGIGVASKLRDDYWRRDGDRRQRKGLPREREPFMMFPESEDAR